MQKFSGFILCLSQLSSQENFFISQAKIIQSNHIWSFMSLPEAKLDLKIKYK